MSNSKYQTLVVAVELEPSCDTAVLAKAKEVVDQYGCDVHFVHALEHLSNYGAAYGVSAGIDVEQALIDEAKGSMSKLAKEFNVADQNQVIRVGPAKHIILEEAERINADLILVGSHGRHGVRLLLGSTANAILHGAACDVLAVRIQE